MLITFYGMPGHGARDLTSSKAFFNSGGVVVQHHEGAADAADHIKTDTNINDDGYRQEYITIRGSRRVIRQTADPPTGVNSFTIWWTVPIANDNKHAIIVELLANSQKFTQNQVVQLVEALVGGP